MTTMTKKEALLQAAKDLFGEYGYADTTFKKISERANVALGLLTHHYGNKERLFLAAGMDVLDNFIMALSNAVENTSTGKDAVLAYCKAYLDFTINPNSNWLVLVRCSPYSDMKTTEDKEVIAKKFLVVHDILEKCISRGIIDETVREVDIHQTALVIVSTLVGVNRNNVLSTYRSDKLYDESLKFIERAIAI